MYKYIFPWFATKV